MELDELIRTRRTQKAYEPGPSTTATLDELFELARWAPNHHLTEPVALPGRSGPPRWRR